MGGGSFVPRPFINREAAVREALVCEREPENTFDLYAVAVKKEGTIIGDLPPKLLRVFAVFATGRYTVTSVCQARATWNGAHYNLHHNDLLIRCRKNSL